MVYSTQNSRVLTAARDTTSSVVAPPCQNMTVEVLYLFSFSTKCSNAKSLASRKISSYSVRHDEITFLAARLHRPPAAPANSSGAGAVSRTVASSPTGCCRIPAAAEAHLERIISHPRWQACERRGCSSHSRRPPIEPGPQHQEAALVQCFSSPRASLRTAHDVQARSAAIIYDVSSPLAGGRSEVPGRCYSNESSTLQWCWPFPVEKTTRGITRTAVQAAYDRAPGAMAPTWS